LVAVVNDALHKFLAPVRTEMMRDDLSIHVPVVKMQPAHMGIYLVKWMLALQKMRTHAH
jgi:hypothetical protein